MLDRLDLAPGIGWRTGPVREAVEREIDMAAWKEAEGREEKEREAIRQALDDSWVEISEAKDKVKEALGYD